MREILLINPGGKRRTKKRASLKRKTKKRSKTAMPKKKRKVRRRTYAAPPKRRRARRNPSRARRAASTARSRARGAFGGLNFKKAIKDMPLIQIGMFSAKWAAKRWGEAATETDPGSWNWASYLKGGLGATAAAFLMGAIRPSFAQKVLEGGINVMVYKAIQNELIAPSEWATSQFGADDDYVPDEYLTGIDDEAGSFMLGPSGDIMPADERHRLVDVMGDVLEPVGPLGDVLEPVGPLGDDAYAKAWGM